jgi:phage tail protein X
VQGQSTWTVVTVARGDTLWDIVDRYYGDAHAELMWAVVEANHEITDPGLIYPGQQITLPPAGGGALEPPPAPEVGERAGESADPSPATSLPQPTVAPGELPRPTNPDSIPTTTIAVAPVAEPASAVPTGAPMTTRQTRRERRLALMNRRTNRPPRSPLSSVGPAAPGWPPR